MQRVTWCRGRSRANSRDEDSETETGRGQTTEGLRGALNALYFTWGTGETLKNFTSRADSVQ